MQVKFELVIPQAGDPPIVSDEKEEGVLHPRCTAGDRILRSNDFF